MAKADCVHSTPRIDAHSPDETHIEKLSRLNTEAFNLVGTLSPIKPAGTGEHGATSMNLALKPDNIIPSREAYSAERQALTRAEQVVHSLRNQHESENRVFDEGSADKMLSYFRNASLGMPESVDDWCATVSFLSRYGQSLDWILLGNPAGLICRAARASRVDAGADHKISALIEAHKQANLELALAIRPITDDDAADDVQVLFLERELEARTKLVEESPKTIQGLHALLSYINSVRAGQHTVSGRPEWIFDENLNDVVESA